jgi:hypothetical protein
VALFRFLFRHVPIGSQGCEVTRVDRNRPALTTGLDRLRWIPAVGAFELTAAPRPRIVIALHAGSAARRLRQTRIERKRFAKPPGAKNGVGNCTNN